MKMAKLGTVLVLFGYLTLGLAEVSVDAQIEALKSASTQDRVKLMNEFKTTLSTLSQEERAEAIEKFILNVQSDSDQPKVRERLRERIRVNQMTETMQRQENQRMNQNQVGSQFLQQNPGVVPDIGTTPNRFMSK